MLEEINHLWLFVLQWALQPRVILPCTPPACQCSGLGFHLWGGAVAPVQTWPAQGRSEWGVQLGPAGQERKDLEMTVHLWMQVKAGWSCWNLNVMVVACLCSCCSLQSRPLQPLSLSLHSLAQTLLGKAGRTPSLGGDLITTSLKDHSLQVSLWRLWLLSPVEWDRAGNWFHSSLVLGEIVLGGQENSPVSQHESGIHLCPASPAVPGSPARWWAARIKDWLSSCDRRVYARQLWLATVGDRRRRLGLKSFPTLCVFRVEDPVTRLWLFKCFGLEVLATALRIEEMSLQTRIFCFGAFSDLVLQFSCVLKDFC